MKTSAAVLEEMGLPAPYQDSQPLSVGEVDLGIPGPGEALVRIAAAGLCHSDLSVIDGSRPRPMPMVLGHEAAGVVEEVGADVSYVRPGDHVVFAFVPACGQCTPCLSGRPALCEPGARANAAGTLLSGARPFRRADEPLHQHLGVSGFAERTVASVASMVTLPPDLPLEQAALFGCALLTGVGAVVNTARAEPGTPVVVFGLGGVGLSAVMGARLVGCHPIVAVDSVESKLPRAERVGASHTLLADETVVDAVREATDGGARYAFEAVGSARVLATAYAATRRGGTTVSIGLPHPDQRLEIPAVTVVTEERRLVGSYMGSSVPRRDIPRYVALYRAGLLPVDELESGTLTLDEINAGFDKLAGGEVVRQVLLFEPVP
ncbi:MAG: zinc-dependent alcohol dehydrogenase family protein [Pseudonocardiaceae bacterium]